MVEQGAGAMKMARWGITAIIAAYAVLAVAYGLTTPLFEKPDEMAHFAYLKRVADGRGFPTTPLIVADDAPVQESSQPPLFYFAAAQAVSIFAPDTSDFAARLIRNPAYPYLAHETVNDNKNVFIHTTPESPRDAGTPRAVYVARLVAALFGALTVYATYRLGCEVWPAHASVALGAAALVAFTPQFIFISSSTSNDSTAAAMSTLVLWTAAGSLRRGFTLRRTLALGMMLGLAALSKASALGLLPLVLIAVAAVRADASTRVTRLRRAALSAGVAALIAAPWYVRSLVLFGDLLGAAPHFTMPWARAEPLSFIKTLNQLPGAWQSFWLAFGWGNIIAPDAVYVLLNVLTLIGMAGAGLWLWQTRRSLEGRLGWLLMAWLVVIGAALFNWVRWLDAALGRLLFPAIASFAVLLSLGWRTLAQQLRCGLIVSVPAVGVLSLAIAAVPLWMVPAYARPTLLTDEQLKQQPGQASDVRYGAVARLVRVDVPDRDWPRPGDEPAFRLCWQPLANDRRPLMILVQLVGAQNRVVATRRTLPGLGAYPMSVWQLDRVFCDTVRVPIALDAAAPALYQVEVAVIDQHTQLRVPAYAPDGTALSTHFVATIKIAPRAYATAPIEHTLQHRLGDQIELIGYVLEPSVVKPGKLLQLRLYWRAIQQPSADYKIFAHVRDAANHIAAQNDSAPQADTYPTSYWAAGEVVIDDRVIEIAPEVTAGHYALMVGLYNPLDQTRLPVDGEAALTEIKLPVDVEVRP